ncbi:asparagine synthase-related protein [Streptomyces cinnamoneus]|uniref:asparagine synthase-related protein n=1 Tax=Streptomyces cinnamoneus TaxID=53446 RepID=UPI00343E3F54
MELRTGTAGGTSVAAPPADVAFLVLPDGDAGRAALAALRAPGARVIGHASGRPWLVGRWPDGAVAVATAGRTRIAVIGDCPLARAELKAAAGRLRDVTGLDELARRLPGSAHLLASAGGRVRVQGGVAGVRSVYRARVAGVTVAADRPDALVCTTTAHVDERLLALRLMRPGVPHPLRERTLWRGVDAVAPGSCLIVDADGTARTARWWEPPEPLLSLGQGAPLLREALAEAVRARGRVAGGVVSADDSGGTDSAAVARLAAAPDRRLITVRIQQRGADDDAGQPPGAGAEHVLLRHDRSPALYAGLDRGTGVLPAEPAHWVRAAARFEEAARQMAARGSRLHFGGHGGDELFTPPAACLHTLARTHPRIAVRHLRERRAEARWPLIATWRAVADSKDFPAWLTHGADRLTSAPPRPDRPQLGWTAELRMPGWVTADAVYTSREVLIDASYEPLAPDRGTHRTLERIRRAGAAVGYATRLAAAHGIRLAAPCLDDRVIEAVLAVHAHERASPHRRKPLLTEAVRDLLPDGPGGRTARRGPDDEDALYGFRRHRRALLALFDGSELARLGLVDDAEVRAALRAPHPTVESLLTLEPTLACEAWLRTLRPAP